MKTEDLNTENTWKKIQKIVEETKYGSVTIIIQDGKIIQVENTVKIRIK